MKNHPFSEFPKHLYRKSTAPVEGLTPAEEQQLTRVGYPGAVIAHNRSDEELARKAGYGDDYVPQKYPKHVGVSGKIANNAEEEKAILASEEE